MEPELHAPPTTRSSLSLGGSLPGSWRKDRVFSAVKTCKCCGKPFRPWVKRANDGMVLNCMKEHLWERQKYCSRSCSKMAENPMFARAARAKVSRTHKRRRIGPTVRGGNGKATEPQRALLRALGPDWHSEFVVATGIPRTEGVPTAYKIDIANPGQKIAVEVDGNSHKLIRNRHADRAQTAFLLRHGWHVLRISNAKALHLCSTCRSKDTLLTTLMEYLSTTAT